MEAYDQVKVSNAQQAQQTVGIHPLGDEIGYTGSETLFAIAPHRRSGLRDDREAPVAQIATFAEVIRRVGDFTVDAGQGAGKPRREVPVHEGARNLLERVYVDDPLYHGSRDGGFDFFRLGIFFHFSMLDQSAIILDFF